MTSKQHLLVVGAGSVGRRHLRNFAALGCVVSAADPRSDRLAEAASDVPLAGQFASVEHAFQDLSQYQGVVICSPPKYHVAAAVAAVTSGVPVFLEKPVSPTAAEADRLVRAVESSSAPLLLGYTYRWWPALNRLRERLRSGELGRLMHVRFVMSAHLADWHPWERYQDFFMASRELGGGALLDESHFIDLMIWIFGVPADVTARVEKLSGLEIDTDDNVDALFGYGDNLRVTLHLDLFGRPHEKYIVAVGERGTLHWSFDPNEIRKGAGAEPTWTHESFVGERNDMFVAAAREFLSVMNGAAPSCTAQDGLLVLEVIEAMRGSSNAGQRVEVRTGQRGWPVVPA